MNVEIERRFFVQQGWRKYVTRSFVIKQGYLSRSPTATVRVRVSESSNTFAYITIKGKRDGISQPEFEYKIPSNEGYALLKMCLPTPIRKIRNRILTNTVGQAWEVDEFQDALEGLVIAEIELKDPAEEFERPAWLAEEITSLDRYSNAQLSAKGLPTEPDALWRKYKEVPNV